jgi:hypothetical protein
MLYAVVGAIGNDEKDTEKAAAPAMDATPACPCMEHDAAWLFPPPHDHREKKTKMEKPERNKGCILEKKWSNSVVPLTIGSQIFPPPSKTGCMTEQPIYTCIYGMKRKIIDVFRGGSEHSKLSMYTKNFKPT